MAARQQESRKNVKAEMKPLNERQKLPQNKKKKWKKWRRKREGERNRAEREREGKKKEAEETAVNASGNTFNTRRGTFTMGQKRGWERGRDGDG